MRVLGLLALSLLARALPAAAEPAAFPTGQVVERVAARADPTQTYALYRPTSYDPARRQPLLLIFDPRGRALQATEIFRPAAERFGWVVMSSYDTRSDGPMEPNDKALRAMWPETTRHNADPRRIYAAGFSGGGILTLLLGLTNNVAGVVDVGGRLPQGLRLEGATFAHYGAAGRADFNALPMRQVDRAIAPAGRPRRLDFFDGAHQWLSAEHATRAIGWLEVVAMGARLRPRDPALIDAIWTEEMAAGAALVEAGRLGEAVEHLEMLVRTFAGLRSVDEARTRLASLRADRRTAELAKEEKKAEQDELAAWRRNSYAEALLRRDPPPTPAELRSAYWIPEMARRAEKPGPRGEAARRVLETIFSHTSFYLANAFLAEGDMRRAVLSLGIANEIRPQAPFVEYNLACALARSGYRGAALDALERAVDEGWSDGTQMLADPDLKPLHAEPRFDVLKRRLMSAPNP